LVTRIELGVKEGFHDAEAEGVLSASEDIGIHSVIDVHFFRVFYLQGFLSDTEKKTVARSLLADVITDDIAVDQTLQRSGSNKTWSVEITYNQGVTDMVAQTTLKGIQDLGIKSVKDVKTARRYEIIGELNESEKETFISKLLMNKVIEHVKEEDEALFFQQEDVSFQLVTVPLLDADKTGLERISKERDLYLNIEEMRTIQTYYKTIGREPTDIELEMLAQTWSEHCSH
jgi:phosphoribosylformylglycinamidine synthase